MPRNENIISEVLRAPYRHYTSQHDYFYNKSFSYGVPNYGGYADDICSYMHNDFVSPSGFTMKQGFLPYNDINYITSYVSNFSSDDEDFMSTSDFEYYSLEDIGSLGSYDCPFNAFNGRNYNVLLHQDSTPVYCYRLPYFYFLSYENSLENRFNLSDFFDNFEDTSWSFSFYGVDSTNNAYDTGFDNGYAVGHQDGYYEGVDDGRATGYENGYDDGYLVGRTDGIASANDYSFLSLFGAVADTPVLMIRSLFNFDFFGVNLLTVVLSLFTALILFYLLRKLF